MPYNKEENNSQKFSEKPLTLEIDNFSTGDVSVVVEVKYKDNKSDLSKTVKKDSYLNLLIDRSIEEIDMLKVNIDGKSFEMTRISFFEWEYPHNARAGFEQNIYVRIQEMGVIVVSDDSKPVLKGLKIKITSTNECYDPVRTKVIPDEHGSYKTGWKKGCVDNCKISYLDAQSRPTNYTDMTPNGDSWYYTPDTINVTAKETSGG